jgi:hypothetical protein
MIGGMGRAETFWWVHLKLPRELQAAVKAAARQDGRTLAGWLRAAITEKLARGERHA